MKAACSFLAVSWSICAYFAAGISSLKLKSVRTEAEDIVGPLCKKHSSAHVAARLPQSIRGVPEAGGSHCVNHMRTVLCWKASDEKGGVANLKKRLGSRLCG